MDLDKVIFLSCLAVIVTIFNSICLGIIIRSQRLMKRSSHQAIASLLLVHVIQGVFVIPSYAAKRAKFTDDPLIIKVICDIFRFSYIFTTHLSSISIVLITIDRVWAVKKPHSYGAKSIKWMKWMIFGASLYVFLLCVVPFIPTRKRKRTCKYVPQREWVVFMFFGITFLVLVTILVGYAYVLMQWLKNQREFNDLMNKKDDWSRCQSGLSNPTFRSDKRKMTVMSFCIVFSYILCFGPSFFYNILLHLCVACFPNGYDDSNTEQTVGFIIKILTFLNGVLSPFIYCIFDKNFKQRIKSIRYRRERRQQAHQNNNESNINMRSIQNNVSF